MRYCSNCGKELNETESFCSNCGQPVGNTSEAITKSNKKSKKKKVLTALLIVFILVFVIPMIIGFAAAVFSDDTDTADENSAVTSDYSEDSEGSGGVSQNDGWIYYESGLLDSKDGVSDYYYAYNMSPNDFINEMNSTLQQQSKDKNGEELNESSLLEYSDTVDVEASDTDTVTTYTYASENGHGMYGCYIDTKDSGIYQVRSVADIEMLKNYGNDEGDAVFLSSLVASHALHAFGIIDYDEIEDINVEMLDYINQGTVGFYKDGILLQFFIDDNNFIECGIRRVTDEQWNTMKQQAEGADVAYVEL